jgi:serine/threonine protein kinase
MDCGLRGTIFYSAAEAIEGDSVDERTDIYSLGITAFEMTTGQRPYPEDDIVKTLDLHLHQDVPDPSTLVADLPDELSHFVRRATRRNPAERYENISQVLQDLEALAARMDMKRQLKPREQRKMMGLLLFYEKQHELVLKQLLKDLSHDLHDIGAELRTEEIKGDQR